MICMKAHPQLSCPWLISGLTGQDTMGIVWSSRHWIIYCYQYVSVWIILLLHYHNYRVIIDFVPEKHVFWCLYCHQWDCCVWGRVPLDHSFPTHMNPSVQQRELGLCVSTMIFKNLLKMVISVISPIITSNINIIITDTGISNPRSGSML